MINLKVVAGIVTYNPDIDRIAENLRAVHDDVDAVFIVDNHSENISELKQLLTGFSKVRLTINPGNFGIARALNQIFSQASGTDTEWVLTLDQDSVCTPGMLLALTDYASTASASVGILCPCVDDRNMGVQVAHNERGKVIIQRAITSGNLVRLSAWKNTGGYAEELFIDGVDFEFCLRMNKHGFQIHRVQQATLLHEMGRGRTVRIFGRNASVMNHAPWRVYYIIRNYLYIGKKYNQRGVWLMEVFKRLFIIAVYEKQRPEKFKYAWKGIRHFFAGKMHKMQQRSH